MKPEDIQDHIARMKPKKREMLEKFAAGEGKTLMQYLADLYADLHDKSNQSIIIVSNSTTGDIVQN